jgi:uncharacterized SAM-dependent methyltransferase
MLTKRQEAELVTSIQGRGEVPLKFSYLGEGAQNWVAIAKKRSGGGINSTEANLLKKRIQDFVESFENKEKINVIDIGCGDGTPILPVLNELKRQNVQFRYIPLDISAEMIDVAEKTVLQNFSNCEVKKVVLDFELGNFSDVTYELKTGGYSNLLCFLGSTVGNFSDRNRVLTNLRDSMGTGDFLLVGVEMTNFSKVTKLISHYTNQEVESLLFNIPSEIGVKKSAITYEVEWNDKENQIECWMILKDDQKIKVGNDSFVLENDEKILLARSVKFNEWTFTKLMSDVGFRTELLTTTKDRGYVLSLVQPTRYNV